MDTVWSVRQAYDEARQMKLSQERYCEKALAGEWTGLGQFPEELRLEALVDILRGKFKVQTHCYEAVDIDAFVRLSNEFQFPVAAFHHAHESYLVPEVLKRGYEHPPASAIFASFSRYKREAYRHSEFAARILADNGLKVAMKSDHPGVVSRYLLHEAQQAHYHGLSANLALASVISTPAEVIGLDHRIGFVKPGYDADVVVWDSHPLALGATPIQVFIDGIPQLENAFVSAKSAVLQKAPKTPNFDREIAETIKYEGLPPLDPVVQTSQSVLFRNVSSVWTKNGAGEVKVMAGANNVLVERGVIVWSGSDTQVAQENIGASLVVDLEGGSITPALVSAGTTLGLQEISGESSATDGMVFDALSTKIPTILGDDTVIRAVDGLQFGTRDALLAYRAGVTSAIVAPSGSQFFHGLSVAFSLASAHKLQSGAILQETVAVHVSLSPSFSASISTQVALLRKILLESDKDTEFGRVAQGLLRLVITVDSADIIATLLRLKSDLETESKKPLKISIIGGAEAHLLAKELAAADVGVILSPPRSFPYNWEHRRILPGPPLSSQSSAAYLAAHGVTVGLGPQGVQGRPEMGGWAAHNLRFDMAWVMLESNGTVSKQEALAMASSNIEKLLGVESQNAEWAVTKGGDLFSFEAKVIGVISATRGLVDLF
ncbi:unnamed protein product [Mycena citricolor]|nr:unnamed protein product [Mycena citricolor]